MGLRLEAELLRRMWPRAPQAKIDAICAVSVEAFAEAGIDDWNVAAELLGNISHENGAGTIIRESGNYRAERILEVFGKGHSSAAVTAAEAELLAHKPEALFERVYNLPHSPKLAKELGNHLPGDGYKFRGGGDLQLTGRESYERIGHLVGHPEIADDPDLLADPALSFRVACVEFARLGCVKLAREGKSEACRIRVNGGRNGMNEVMVWVRRWKTVLPQATTPDDPPPRGADTDYKTLKSSKIMKGVISSAVPTAIGAGAKVAESANSDTATVPVSDIADKLQHASDTITTIQVAADSTKAIVHTVKPVLGLPPNLWAAIAIACGLIALGTLAYTGWQRWAKLRDQGV